MKGVVIHKFWSDDFDMDLLRVFPNLPMLLGATAAIELWTVGHESYGRLNHPTCWDTPHGLTAFFWFQPPQLRRDAHGWFWLDGGYVGNDQALRATWLEALRDCWAHQYAISLEGRIVWDSQPMWLDFERIMYVTRGWATGDISGNRNKVLRSILKANRRFAGLIEGHGRRLA